MFSFISLVAGLMVTAMANAFYVPVGVPEGTYVVNTTDGGNHFHFLLDAVKNNSCAAIYTVINHTGIPTFDRVDDGDEVANTAALAGAMLPASSTSTSTEVGSHPTSGKRLTPNNVFCHPKTHLGIRDTDSANLGLDAYCGNDRFIPAHTHVYAVAGGTLAYICNYQGGNHCSVSGRRKASAKITAKCGHYVAGLDNIAHWGIMYGYDRKGTNMCNNEN